MSSQAIHDIAMAMKKAVKRSTEGSDSDDPIEMVSNRGNKLRKRAKYVHEGQLAPPSCVKLFKEKITYGEGQYKRDVISRVPILYDDEGYEVDVDDDDEDRVGAAFQEATEFYPYANVRIEDLLAPITSAAELPDHPTLSKPFTSKILTELTRNACEMVQKERASLWKMKHLLTKLGGDHTWVPCGILEDDNDIALFGDGRESYREHLMIREPTHTQSSHIDEGTTELPEAIARAETEGISAETVVEAIEEYRSQHEEAIQPLLDVPKIEVEEAPPSLLEAPAENVGLPDIRLPAQGDVSMIDAPVDPPFRPPGPLPSPIPEPLTPEAEELPLPELPPVNEVVVAKDEVVAGDEPDPDETLVDDSTILEDDQVDGDDTKASTNGIKVPDVIIGEDQDAEDELPEEEVDDVDAPEPRRMRTRAQAQAVEDDNNPHTRSMSPESTTSYIAPYFLAPVSSRPDRNLGIPGTEADEVRRILQLYLQKQEEVCRGAEKVYNGLLKAERMRSTVFKWAKAEGHVGEMSDGEDWYDLDEWGLAEELKKGQDEEEEDAATTAKKTRTRRQ